MIKEFPQFNGSSLKKIEVYWIDRITAKNNKVSDDIHRNIKFTQLK